MGLSDADRERIKPYNWHDGELTPPAHWNKLEGKVHIEPGAREPEAETRREFCAVWEQLQGRLNAWLAPGPLNFELRRYYYYEGDNKVQTDEATLEARRRLREELGDKVQFRFR